MEIVSLPQAPKEKPNERVIEYAKEMYDRALTGEITAIATVCVTNERKVEFDFRYDDPHARTYDLLWGQSAFASYRYVNRTR